VGLKATVAFGIVVLAAVPGTSAFAQNARDYLSPSCPTGPDAALCEQNRGEFLKEHPQAMRGDYQSQRNVAFCMITGCDGAVRVNTITGCAWRMVIVASGSMKVDRSDTSHIESCRKRLSGDEWVAASAQAQTLSSKMKRR
jgi:hypothetical protein